MRRTGALGPNNEKNYKQWGKKEVIKPGKSKSSSKKNSQDSQIAKQKGEQVIETKSVSQEPTQYVQMTKSKVQIRDGKSNSIKPSEVALQSQNSKNLEPKIQKSVNGPLIQKSKIQTQKPIQQKTIEPDSRNKLPQIHKTRNEENNTPEQLRTSHLFDKPLSLTTKDPRETSMIPNLHQYNALVDDSAQNLSENSRLMSVNSKRNISEQKQRRLKPIPQNQIKSTRKLKLHSKSNVYSDEPLPQKHSNREEQVQYPQEDEESEEERAKYESRYKQVYDDPDSTYEQSDNDDQKEEEQAKRLKMSKMDKLQNIKIAKAKEIEDLGQQIEVELQKQAMGANSDQDIKPNKRFKNFNDVFSSLTKSKNIVTKFPIVDCIITYNSKSAITICKRSDRESHIEAYSLETYQITFQEMIGGKENSYIKIKEVEQNSSGTNFVVVYLDDGIFKLRVLGDTQYFKPTRDEQEIKDSELIINKELIYDDDDEETQENGMNNHTMPINGFSDPYITCTFCTDEVVFVNLFHNATLMHHQFFYNIQEQRIFRKTKFKMKSNEKNFPYKCFFSAEYNHVYSFYRQGESFRIPFDPENPGNTERFNKSMSISSQPRQIYKPKPEFIFEKIYDKDLGQMYLINGTALIARSSSKILFFKLKLDPFTGESSWNNYHTIHNRGFIYFIKGNKRIQITTDQKIFFYLIDPVDFMPTLENVMFNFMNCTQMMFGSKVKYGITFKTNASSFDIYRRKYEHNYQVNAVSEYDLDGSRGLPIEAMNAFLISKVDRIKFFDTKTFKEIKECEIVIPLMVSKEREPNQIISMQISQNQEILAVISGKNLNMNEQKPNQLFIFRRVRDLNTDAMDQFEQVKKIVIKDNPKFLNICMQFCFQRTKQGRQPTHLIFATSYKLFTLNFENESISDLVTFEDPLQRQPEFFLMNDAQTVSIIASMEDGIYFNHRNKKQVDLDSEFEISAIKEIIYDYEDKVFYLLANKHHGKLGLFLIKFSERNPQNKSLKFFLKYKNKLDISDADIAVLRNPVNNFKELIISYKTIFINTYTVRVIDISTEDPWPIYSHESFQLWESQVTGFFLERTMDFVTINREGINVLTLDSTQKKSLMHQNGQEKMIHSLESANYLKIDPKNLIQFQFAGDEKVISIVQQYWKKSLKQGNETEYENIYNIRIHEITLRELLLFQSLYVCNTLSDILKLVQSQPKPAVFFKSFLELDGTNMASILSFDSRSLKHLLSDRNKEFFTQEFPMFFKNKIVKTNKPGKYFYRSAIDMALRNNQVSAVACITEYIVKYQNNFVSSFLYQANFKQILSKGIKVKSLLDSNVFCRPFDFDEWPSTHIDENSYVRPFNFSVFDIREAYRDVFWEEEFQPIDEGDQTHKSDKFFKVSYKLNMIPSLAEFVSKDSSTGKKSLVNEKVSLMQMCIDAEHELEMFDSENLQKVIKFKWDEYTRKFHMVGCIMHFLYITLLIVYVNAIYIQNDEKNKKMYEHLLIFGIIYPAFYDWSQMLKMGITEYFSEFQSYLNQLYIWASVANVISQNTTEPFAFHNKLLMTVIMLMQISKTFFFLRIFESLSFLVTMIYQVMSDLKVFLLFFSILIVLFAMVFAVIGIGNTNIRGELQDFSKLIEDGEEDEPENFPFEEYEFIGLFAGNIFTTLRIALGDFDFDPQQYTTLKENYLYWIIWLIVVTMTCIIFLNFIIAEASNSYAVVKESLTALTMKERASLIAEAENQIPFFYKDDSLFPKYIIVREADT